MSLWVGRQLGAVCPLSVVEASGELGVFMHARGWLTAPLHSFIPPSLSNSFWARLERPTSHGKDGRTVGETARFGKIGICQWRVMGTCVRHTKSF